jgi:hypothetical protein
MQLEKIYATQFVSDQHKALGADNPTGKGQRFLAAGTRGQDSDFQLVLWPGKPGEGQPFDGRVPASCTIETADCRAAYEELRSRGVTFETGVLEYPWGSVAAFVDADGNRLQPRQGR